MNKSIVVYFNDDSDKEFDYADLDLKGGYMVLDQKLIIPKTYIKAVRLIND